MKTAKLSLVNVSIIAVVFLAGVSVWTISRNSAFDRSVTTFESATEIVVAPVAAKTVARPIASPVKAVVLPAPKVTPAPLPVISPRVLTRFFPRYPAAAVEKGIEGTVVLCVLVSESGKADKVEVRSSSGSPDLDRSASSAMGAWIFEPARRGEQAIASWFEMPVTFRIK